MENKFTPELIEKAKAAKSAEDILAIAKENGIVLGADEAKAYFDRLNKSGELSDEELDSVSGGCGGRTPCPNCGRHLWAQDGICSCSNCGFTYKYR